MRDLIGTQAARSSSRHAGHQGCQANWIAVTGKAFTAWMPCRQWTRTLCHALHSRAGGRIDEEVQSWRMCGTGSLGAAGHARRHRRTGWGSAPRDPASAPVSVNADTPSSPVRARWRRVRFTTAVSAGVLDSGLASAGTFVAGLAAVRYLPLSVLGTYALAYVAFLLAGNVPGILIYTPAEVLAVARAKDRGRLGVIRSSLRLGVPVGLLAAALMGAAVVAVPSTTPVDDRLALAISLFGFAALSPAQDHLRRLLHAADRSWDACSTSALRLCTIVLALSALAATDRLDQPGTPFGVLTLATVLSGAWALRRGRPWAEPAIDLTWARAVSQGGILVVGSMTQFASGFVTTAVVTASSGAVAVAQVEAVRLVSQPVTVVMVGLLSVFGPRIMSAAASGDRQSTRRHLRRSAAFFSAITVVWVLLLSSPGSSTPVGLIVPRAYDVPALLQVMVVVQALSYAPPIWRMVLLARARPRPLLAVDLVTAALGPALVLLLLRDEGPWALVISGLVTAVVSVLAVSRLASTTLRREDGLAEPGHPSVDANRGGLPSGRHPGGPKPPSETGRAPASGG